MPDESSLEKSKPVRQEKEPTIRQLDQELEEEEFKLKDMPHGIHMGATEMWKVASHPAILKFFANAEEVLDLDVTKRERLAFLKSRYLDGELSPTELKELKTKFFNPYFRKIRRKNKKS